MADDPGSIHRRNMSRAFCIWAASLAAGCGFLGVASQTGCSGGVAGNKAAVQPAKAAVATFLEAVKRGDDAAARGMLTKVAAAKTQEMGISVAPPVPATATYSIRDAEVVGESDDLVHVATTWTDTDSEGFTTTDNVVWVVRLDPEGWRVVGMATRVFDDMPPLLLNFEDPEDMLNKQQLVADELEKRAKMASQKAGDGQRTARGDAAGTSKVE